MGDSSYESMVKTREDKHKEWKKTGRELGSEFEFNPSAPPLFRIAEIRASLPGHCWIKDPWRSMSYVFRDVVVVVVGLVAAAMYFDTWVFWPLYWAAQGTMCWAIFVLGHDWFRFCAVVMEVFQTALFSHKSNNTCFVERGMEPKKVIAMLLVVVLVLAQSHHGLVEAKYCKVQCLLKCIGVVTSPIVYGSCIGLCMLACKIPPSQAVMACTTNCANNAIKNYHPDHVVDPKAGERFVDSCYNSCKEKN